MGHRRTARRRSGWRWWALTLAALLSAGLLASASRAAASRPAPAGLAVVEVGHERVQLQWEGARSRQYRIHWQVPGQPGNAGSEDPNVITAGPNLVRGSAFGLELDTTYVFRVVEIVGGQESPPSSQVTATTLSEVPADVRVVSANDVTVNLAWAGIHEEWYRIDWHVAGDPQSRGTKTLVYARQYPYPRPPGVNAVVSGLSPRTAYVFEIVHLDGGPEGPASAPSEPLAFTTPPYEPPAVAVELDGNDVTLSWPKPANALAQLRLGYDVHVDGVLETRIFTAADPVRITIPRQASGVTHRYAVLHTNWDAPSITDPVAVAVPPAADTTPPTTPGWVWTTGPPLDCGESPDTPMFEIVEESVDDTTPRAEIHYEAFVRHPLTGALYVGDYDLPLTGPEAPVQIRAVDEAGNRSATTAGTQITPDC